MKEENDFQKAKVQPKGVTYESVGYKKGCSSIEVLIDFINSVIAIHVFHKQLHFYFSLEDLWSHEFSV